MGLLEEIMKNPAVAFFAFSIGVVGSIVTIWTTVVSSLKQKNKELMITVQKYERIINANVVDESKNLNQNTVNQGEKSQYFQDNKGTVKIDIK